MFTRHPDGAAMGFCDGSDQGKAQAGSADVVLITPSRAVELLEDTLVLIWVDPYALIVHIDSHDIVMPLNGNDHATS